MEHLPTRHRERVTGVYAAMLNPPSVAEQQLEADGLSVPYIDPAFRSGAVYGAFLRDLLDRGLIELVAETGAFLGVFFVGKKDGRLRLIFDTRVANAYFMDPPHTALPSAGAWAQQELLPEQQTDFPAATSSALFAGWRYLKTPALS